MQGGGGGGGGVGGGQIVAMVGSKRNHFKCALLVPGAKYSSQTVCLDAVRKISWDSGYVKAKENEMILF